MSSDDRKAPADRPFAFSGIGTFPKFNCAGCGQWKGTAGRRMLAVRGMARKAWVCGACVAATKSETREQA